MCKETSWDTAVCCCTVLQSLLLHRATRSWCLSFKRAVCWEKELFHASRLGTRPSIQALCYPYRTGLSELTCKSQKTSNISIFEQGLQPNHHHPLLLVMGWTQSAYIYIYMYPLRRCSTLLHRHGGSKSLPRRWQWIFPGKRSEATGKESRTQGLTESRKESESEHIEELAAMKPLHCPLSLSQTLTPWVPNRTADQLVSLFQCRSIFHT